MDSSLPAFETYRKSVSLPWKMIIHVLLVILTSFQALFVLVNITSYIRAQDRQIFNIFVNPNDKTDVNFKRKIYLYSVPQIRDHIKMSINNYYNLEENFMEAVVYHKEDKENIIMEANYIDNSLLKAPFTSTELMGNHSISRQSIYIVNNSSLGPFDYPDSDVKIFLNDILSLKLSFGFQTYIPYYYFNNYYCFNWQINQFYNFKQRAHFVKNLQIQRTSCDNVYGTSSFFNNFTNHLIWIHILILIFAILSLIQTLKYIYKVAILYGRIRKDYKNKNLQSNYYVSSSKESDYYNPLLDKNYDKNVDEIQEKEEELEEDHTKYKERKKIFNNWYLVSLVGNTVQLLASGMCLIDPDNILIVTEILVGFGCTLAYINMLRYLEYNEYSIILHSIRKGLPTMLKYLFGVLPVLLGFAILGVCLFWRSERFVDMPTAIFTLFCFMKGDSIFLIFKDLKKISFFFGQIYCYMFGFVFSFVVVNVFIAITEEAYMTIRMNSPYYWIYSYLKLEDKFVELREDKDEIKVLPEHMKQSTFSRPERYTKKTKNTTDIPVYRLSTFVQGKVFPHEKISSFSPVKKLPTYAGHKDLNIQMHSLDQSVYKSKFATQYNKERNELKNDLKKFFSNNDKNIDDIIKLCEELSRISDSDIKNSIMNFIALHFCKLQHKLDIIKGKLSHK